MSNNADASGSNDTIEYRMPYRLEESTNMFGKMTIEPKLILSTVDGSVLNGFKDLMMKETKTYITKFKYRF